MNPVQIRDAVPRDADEIGSIHVRSWRSAYRGLIDQEILDTMSIADRAEGWRRLIDDPLPSTLGLLVAVRDTEVVGWTSFGRGRDDDHALDGEVYGIYADPGAWSTGVGHALLAAAESRMTDAGHTRAYLWVLDGNNRADAFYRRHGWTVDGATKVEQRPGLTLPEHRRVKLLRP